MLVSVIIPTYNSGHLIETAIRSVLAQTYEDIEILVVDDGSTDHTRAVVDRFHTSCTYLSQTHSGPSAARNRGIRHSSGELIAFLDADDAWRPDKLAVQVARFRQSPEVGLLESGYYLCDARLRPLRYHPPARLRGRVFEDMLSTYNAPNNSTVMVRRQLIDRVGGFDPSFSVLEDYELWLRIAEQTLFEYSDEALAYTRIHEGNSLVNGRAILDAHRRILRRARVTHPGVASDATEALGARFALKIMCLHHQTRDALATARHAIRSYALRDTYGMYLYLLLLLIPKAWIPRLRAVVASWRAMGGSCPARGLG